MLRPCFASAALFIAVPCSAHCANLPPKTTGTIPDATLYRGATAEVVDLKKYFTDPDTSAVRLTTVLGNIDIALFSQAAPITVTNFLHYVDSGRYEVTDPTTGEPAPVFFHRSVPGFVIQGGGYLATANPNLPASLLPTRVLSYDPIRNEPGISNTRGTIAMAKIDGQPNSATSEWFINLADNSATFDSQNGGFTVFGRVLGGGMQVAALPVFNFGSPYNEIPLVNYSNADFNQGKIVAPANTVAIPGITHIPALTYTATSNQPALASVAISGTKLLVTPKAIGTAQITVTATDVDGASVSQSFAVEMISYPVHLANISTRVVVGAQDDALVGDSSCWATPRNESRSARSDLPWRTPA